MACHIEAWPWQCRPVSFPVNTKSTSFSSRTFDPSKEPRACCRKPLFLKPACRLVPSTTAEHLESLAAVWKAPFKLSFGGSGGVARRHRGIAKMAAVSEGMKTVTLCYQSFQSVPCPCGLCFVHAAAHILELQPHHTGCSTCKSVHLWIASMRNRCMEVIRSGVNI